MKNRRREICTSGSVRDEDGQLLIYSVAAHSCIWQRGLPGCRRCPASRERKPIRPGRCASLLVFRPAARTTSTLAAAKANLDAMRVASAGVGSTSHVFWELFRSMTGTRMLHVPYRGGAPALTDLLAQQVQVYFATPADTMECISVCDDARSSLRAYTAHEVGDRLADLIGAVFLDEMAPLHRHFGLVRPGAANFPLPADQDRAWVCINKELRNMGLGKPGRIVFNHLRNHARPCKRGPPVCPD